MAENGPLWHGISMSKPARSELFSWRLPFFFALLLVCGMGASFAWANSGPARFYTDPNRAAAECNVAAGLASELAAERPDARFWPKLARIAPDDQFTTLYGSAKAVFVWPLTFDCSGSFSERGLAITVDSGPAKSAPPQFYFSRIALSEGGRVATVEVTMTCGFECSGFRDGTIWRLEGQRWFLVKRINSMIIN